MTYKVGCSETPRSIKVKVDVITVSMISGKSCMIEKFQLAGKNDGCYRVDNSRLSFFHSRHHKYQGTAGDTPNFALVVSPHQKIEFAVSEPNVYQRRNRVGSQNSMGVDTGLYQKVWRRHQNNEAQNETTRGENIAKTTFASLISESCTYFS